jgi:hypothetical protein
MIASVLRSAPVVMDGILCDVWMVTGGFWGISVTPLRLIDTLYFPDPKAAPCSPMIP